MAKVDEESGLARVSTRVEVADVEALERIAAHNQRSVAAELRVAIKEHIRRNLIDRGRT